MTRTLTIAALVLLACTQPATPDNREPVRPIKPARVELPTTPACAKRCAADGYDCSVEPIMGNHCGCCRREGNGGYLELVYDFGGGELAGENGPALVDPKEHRAP